jgi:hypothetical protein
MKAICAPKKFVALQKEIGESLACTECPRKHVASGLWVFVVGCQKFKLSNK